MVYGWESGVWKDLLQVFGVANQSSRTGIGDLTSVVFSDSKRLLVAWSTASYTSLFYLLFKASKITQSSFINPSYRL